MTFRFDWTVIVNDRELLLEGLQITLALGLLATLLSLAGGLLLAVARVSPRPWLARPAYAYIEVFRNTPLLIQLYLIYFGLPILGVVLPALTTGILALTLQHSAFIAEIFRGGFLAVSKAQREAGMAMGMRPPQTFRIVVLPQALAASVPALTGAAVILFQDTSLLAAIAVVELTMAAKVIAQKTAASYEVFITIAVLYLTLSWLVASLGRGIERITFVHR